MHARILQIGHRRIFGDLHASSTGHLWLAFPPSCVQAHAMPHEHDAYARCEMEGEHQMHIVCHNVDDCSTALLPKAGSS